ncbi:hypothetical protein C2845_PM06G28110 [Panicum miliaceum]|uniref:Protein kinase domain-containing protein n=1 Tax=Panicum miliaceum TaxID=4540 RepID=A0A3L6RDQ3_PANMI|nr:hypothetical protein C2845_PM06G28110 [Panicum miliaceum]
MYAGALANSTATAEVAGAGAERVAATRETSAVGARFEAICDMIEEHRNAGTAISARCAASTSAMIDDVAATAAEGRPWTGRRKRRIGPSLHDVIGARRRRGIPFTESEARRAMAQLLAGVRCMHAHGIVHRDLKPGNVLVGEHDRRLKICDLGLSSSAAAPPPDTQQVDGTIGYIAPEVLLCEKDCGAPVDIWTLGCIMAELVMGQSLFPEDDLCQQLISIVDLLGIPDDVSLMPLGITAAAPSKLREKVPEERLSAAGFDVLRGLLQYDSKDRLTAVAALRMPWFAAKDD